MSVDAALVRLRAGSPADVAAAVAALEAAGRDGDPEGSRHLATLAAAGIGMPQDWSRALDHLLVGALGGSASARGQLSLLASGGDPFDDWRALRDRVRLDGWTEPARKRVLETAPRVVAIKGFLGAGVCRWLISRAAGRLTQAMTFGEDGAPAVTSRTRSNSALEMGIADCDVVVLLTRARIAATIGVPTAALETSQILHYAVGEQFARHYDWLDPTLPEVAAHGQRIVTFLVYLNDGFEGGETEFPRLGLRHRGEAGDALYFGNIEPSGAPDRRTIHAGLPPIRGEKWLFSQWVRNMARV